MTAFPGVGHDHQRCLAGIMGDAARTCAERGVRLTPWRRHVLEVIASSHAAIGAYAVIERLAGDGRRVAPISVYRALDFLMAHGLVHRLASLNAYVACPRSAVRHGAQFLICRRCGAIGEIASAAVDRAIAEAAVAAEFTVAAPLVEVAGYCRSCSDRADAHVQD
jgi:Fur family zinc uptake transcriptional regulator